MDKNKIVTVKKFKSIKKHVTLSHKCADTFLNNVTLFNTYPELQRKIYKKNILLQVSKTVKK